MMLNKISEILLCYGDAGLYENTAGVILQLHEKEAASLIAHVFV